jgi:hypothetical protein
MTKDKHSDDRIMKYPGGNSSVFLPPREAASLGIVLAKECARGTE